MTTSIDVWDFEKRLCAHVDEGNDSFPSFHFSSFSPPAFFKILLYSPGRYSNLCCYFPCKFCPDCKALELTDSLICFTFEYIHLVPSLRQNPIAFEVARCGRCLHCFRQCAQRERTGTNHVDI
jgi:hypothetical protein